MFNIVKRYYEMKLYSVDDVAKFVRVGKLTPEQYKEITGQDFVVV